MARTSWGNGADRMLQYFKAAVRGALRKLKEEGHEGTPNCSTNPHNSQQTLRMDARRRGIHPAHNRKANMSLRYARNRS